MFNNIFYFIAAILIFNLSYSANASENSFLFCFVMLLLSWLIFAGYCRWVFRGLQSHLSNHGGADDGHLTAKYQRLIVRLSVLAIVLFASAVYILSLKYWVQMIPGVQRFSVLQGSIAMSLFFLYLCTIWYFACPAYKVIFRSGITRRSFVNSNFRLNVSILFPWIALSLAYDLILLVQPPGSEGLTNRVDVQVVFFAGFLAVMMIFMPVIVQYWWGCKPLKASEKGRQLEVFLREKAFKYRRLLKWPIFEGRMLTAGIMGIVPRYRYILITDSLFEMLSTEELEAVLAHEMGHAKYYHLLVYLLFFAGFVLVCFGLFDLFFYLLYAHPVFPKMAAIHDSQAMNYFYLVLSVPMIITMFVYFRYVMGFFMRNFERQADLYSVRIMGTSKPIISSLEKIAYVSGKSRDLPNWHHFSIRQRVDCLWQSVGDPGLIRRHNRFLLVSFLVYLVSIAGLGYLLNFSTMKQNLTYSLVGKVLNREIVKQPDNIVLYQDLAMVYHQMGKHREAIKVYEKIIDLDPSDALALNNLAWILVTAPNQGLRDNARALDLAGKAVSLKRLPAFLDTLAQAYYANGLIEEALMTIEEAISLATENRSYYEKQLRKLSSASPKGSLR